MSADTTFKIPKFKLPPFALAAGLRLPQWPNSLALVAALNMATRMKLLPEDSLAMLTDKQFVVEVLDAGQEAHFRFDGKWFWPLFSWEKPADLRFSADLQGYLKLLTRQEDPDTLFFNRELSIEGDTELGLVVKNMLDAVEWPPALLTRWLESLRKLRPSGAS